MDPSIRSAWATNPTQSESAEERPATAIEGKRDLRLAGYRGIIGNIMSWTGRVVTVVVHQEGKRDQIEYLDKGSVAATYLRLSGMTGISDRAEMVYELSEDKEIQEYALRSISQYHEGKIHVERIGDTKNLSFDYVNFSDLVKEKLFHIEVLLKTKDGTEEKHFANPIAMASRCLERSKFIGVSDNPALVRELALSQNIQRAAWDSLENEHGANWIQGPDWVKGERDAQGEVVPFRYNMNKFIKTLERDIYIVGRPKHESFLTRLIHSLFGRKEVGSMVTLHTKEALSKEEPPEELHMPEKATQLPEINPEIVKPPVPTESEYEPMPLDAPTMAITARDALDERVEDENGVVGQGADLEQRTLQNTQDELADLSNIPLESPEPLPVQEADLPEEEIQPPEINPEIVEQPVAMELPESEYEPMPLDTPTTDRTPLDERVEEQTGVVDEGADLPESISVLPKSPQVSTEAEKMPPLRFQGVDLSKHLDATTATLLIRYLMTLYKPNYQPANTNFAALGNIQVTIKEPSGKETTVGLQKFVKGLTPQNQEFLKVQLAKYYGDQQAKKITGTGETKTTESLLSKLKSTDHQ